ncbi:MAG: pyridoxal phosphate-dependent decarboxylase family protein [Angustibacter sp.]
MHSYTDEVAALSAAILAYARERSQLDPVPLDRPLSFAELSAAVGQTISPQGMGGLAALDLFTERLAPACISTDHPRYLSFIPCAPTEASRLFDLVVGVSSIYGGSWLEGAGAVYAENQALAWIAGLAGLPKQAAGVFVPGGTIGNLSALVAARHRARERAARQPGRWVIVGTDQAHSSIHSACSVMDVDFLAVPGDDRGRLTGANLRRTLAACDPEIRAGVCAVVATAGTTNFGIIDDLDGVAEVCAERGIWFHVDGAYGGAGLAAPSIVDRYRGIARCDSFIVDPHKWLFAPFDACALLYRDPGQARAAHAQRAGYLAVLTDAEDFNPAEYSIGLTRRARGLPLWFSLATYGTEAYARAMEQTISVATYAASEVKRRSYVELLREPDTSVVVFRRLGWTAEQYRKWSDRLLQANFAFVVPTVHNGETVARFAIVNPNTQNSDISSILDTMA